MVISKGTSYTNHETMYLQMTPFNVCQAKSKMSGKSKDTLELRICPKNLRKVSHMQLDIL